MTYSKFGENPKQESVWTAPLEVNRINTDVSFIIGFGVFIVFWIAISIYAICAGNPEHILHPKYLEHVYYFMQEIFNNIDEAKYIILGGLTWPVVLLFIFSVLYRWTTKAFVIITIVLSSIILVLLYGLLVYFYLLVRFNLYLFIPLAAVTILYGWITCAFVTARIEIVCKTIKESCQVMFFFPSTFIFAVIQFSLQLLIAVFALCVYIYLLSIRVTSSENKIEEPLNTMVPPQIYLFHLINLCGFLWATWFVMGIGRMVLTATFATWYQAKDKNSIPMMIMPKSFVMVIRYHAGSLAYASSLFTIIPMFYIIWKHGLDRLKKNYKQPILILSWLTILMKFSFDALTMCAIHGNTFYKSAKESYILHMKLPVLEMAINILSEYVLVLGTVLLPTFSCVLVCGYCFFLTLDISYEAKTTAVIVVTIVSFLMSLTFFMVFRSASNTIRYCYMEDFKLNNKVEYELQVNDASIHDVHQDP